MSIFSFAKKMAGREEQKKSAPQAQSKAQQKSKQPSNQKAAEGVTATAAVGIQLIPSLTEKAVDLQARSNTYAFRVGPRVSKGQIAAAIKARYSVDPVLIRTAQRTPKTRRRGKSVGLTAAWKRAYVTLPKGKKIDFTV